MLEHGGDLDKAMNYYGGDKSQWIDLSTGINPYSYPIPKLSISDWQNLPTNTEITNLELIIKSKLKISSEIVLVPGAQIAISVLPFLLKKNRVKILSPTYNEYKFCFQNAGLRVSSCNKFSQLFNAEIAILVNPNNPDGKIYGIDDLIKLSKSVKILIVDESFIDSTQFKSIVSQINTKAPNIIVIRSFGKFYGLAGIRLGFVISNLEIIKKFKKILGPWPISKMSIKIASNAFQDKNWIKKTKLKLSKKSELMDKLMQSINWKLIGGTNLFRLYLTPNSNLAQESLAKKYIWSRKFSYSKKWVRLGIPNDESFEKLKKIVESLKI